MKNESKPKFKAKFEKGKQPLRSFSMDDASLASLEYLINNGFNASAIVRKALKDTHREALNQNNNA